MILVEQTGVPAANWPVAEFREHLRLGSGFADDAVQDVLLERLLKAAAAVIERRTGKVLLARTYLWTLSSWRGLAREMLPVAPVNAVTELRIVDAAGVPTTIAPDRYRLEQDLHRPALAARGLGLPSIATAGQAEVVFEAGFSATWDGVPPDLGQAVMLLAAHFHENRHAVAESADPVPLGVDALIAPFRPVRLFGRWSA